MAVAPTLSWLAFKSAEPNRDWDAKFYLGASIWYAADPARILTWLREVEEHGDLIEEFQPYDVTQLHWYVLAAARHTEPCVTALAERAKHRKEGQSHPAFTMPADAIREAAKALRAELEGKQDVAERLGEVIWKASETLRRALAASKLTAYGWPGRGPIIDENATAPPPPTQPIPREVFSGPVTVAQRGILAFARGDGSGGYDHEVLWSGLLFNTQEVLALDGSEADEQPSAPPASPAPDPPRDRGGAPPKHNWAPFDDEYRRYLQHLRESQVAPTMLARELRDRMRRWARTNMKKKNPEDPEPPTSGTVNARVNKMLKAEAGGSSKQGRT
jgi:hypothetical protein